MPEAQISWHFWEFLLVSCKVCELPSNFYECLVISAMFHEIGLLVLIIKISGLSSEQLVNVAVSVL